MWVKMMSGSTASLQILEDVLDLVADVGEETVAKPVDDHLRALGCGEECLTARPGLVLTHPLGPEHDPRDLEVRVRPRECEQRCATPDLDVVGMRAEHEDATATSVEDQRELEHDQTLLDIRTIRARKCPAGPLSVWMNCRHTGLHAVKTAYDREAGVLVFFWVCEVCLERLGDVRRERYRPRFDRCDPSRRESARRRLAAVR